MLSGANLLGYHKPNLLNVEETRGDAQSHPAKFTAYLQASMTNGFLTRDQQALLLEQGVEVKFIDDIAQNRLRLLGGNDAKDARIAFCRKTAGVLNNQYGERYNIVVYKKNHPVKEEIDPSDYIDFGEMPCEDHPTFVFKYIVFKKGVVTNSGDRGYLNWCCVGQFHRNEGRVTFEERA